MSIKMKSKIGLSKLLIGKSIIEDKEYTLSGILYLKKLAYKNTMIGNQQAISVTVTKHILVDNFRCFP